MSIPKTIHYCWFGKGQLPELAIKCINSWKKFCPDYEIVEWNENNFDLNMNKYVEQSYEKRKFAFVTDYVRLWVLYNFGGVYMDTDVELVKNIDCFLEHPAFSGFENNLLVPTGIMGSVKHNNWIRLLLQDYNDLQFIREDNSLDCTTNVERISKKTRENYVLNFDGTFQDIGVVVFYPPDYLCAKDFKTGKIFVTENTHAIHHFSGSWHSPLEKKYGNMRRYLLNRHETSGNMLWFVLLNLLTGSVRAFKNLSELNRKVLN